jgi:acetyltransferase-like isoleucine patch superfamily enzyme
MRTLIAAFMLLLPWPLRRRFLVTFWGYDLHPTSRIGLAWIFPKHLCLEAHAHISHFTLCKGLDLLHLKEYASIGRGNWITGFPTGPSRHFAHQPQRVPELVLGRHTAITNRHLIDCTASVTLGDFTTFAGFHSQILTHSIDLEENRQSSAPIVIGEYCFVGTNCVILGGSRLPSYSVLGAKSLLRDAFSEEYTLYAGTPAAKRKELPADWKYFGRSEGYVW